MPDDRVTRLMASVRQLGETGRSDGVSAWLNELDELSDDELLRFDQLARSWRVGFAWSGICARRLSGAAARMSPVLGLVSTDGFERQRAVEQADLRPAVVALIGVRCLDWVSEVRDAALARMEHVPGPALLDRLGLLERLTQGRARAGALDALLARRLTDADLRAATRAPGAEARRAGWRRLIARGACTPDELSEWAARDPDVRVRALAAAQLPALDEPDRRAVANALVGDPIGWLAGRGLDVLVELDGAAAIVPALTAPNATLRRQARGWAALRDVDSRLVYHDRLRREPGSAVALVGLAELADPADGELLRQTLGDPRARVRAAALKALARLDMATAKPVALEEIVAGPPGRVARVAAAVLGTAALDAADLDRLEEAALDGRRPPRSRLRALALLHQARWRHLTTIIQARRTADPALDRALDQQLRWWLSANTTVSRGPDATRRRRLAALLPELDGRTRRSIEFILRTTR